MFEDTPLNAGVPPTGGGDRYPSFHLLDGDPPTGGDAPPADDTTLSDETPTDDDPVDPELPEDSGGTSAPRGIKGDPPTGG
jgi:hypothetical protein